MSELLIFGILFFVLILRPIFYTAFISQRSRFIRLHIVDGEIDLVIVQTPDLKFIPPNRLRSVIEGCYKQFIDTHQDKV